MIKFEVLKVLREKRLFLLFIFFVVTLLLPLFWLKNDSSFKYFQYKTILEQNHSRLFELQEKTRITQIQKENEALEAILKALDEHDDDQLLKAEYQYERLRLQEIKAGTLTDIKLEEQEEKVQQLVFFMENDLKRMDKAINEFPATHYIHYLLTDYLPYTYFLGIISLVLAHFSTLEKRKETSDFYQIVPVPSGKKFLSKWLVLTVSVLVFVYGGLFLAFLVAMAKNGVGSWDYPIHKLLANGSIEMKTITTVVLQSLGLFFLLVVFFSLLSSLFAFFTGSRLVNIEILFAIVLLSKMDIVSSKYSLTNLLNFSAIASGVTVAFSTRMLLVYIFIISLLIYRLLRKKRNN